MAFIIILHVTGLILHIQTFDKVLVKNEIINNIKNIKDACFSQMIRQRRKRALISSSRVNIMNGNDCYIVIRNFLINIHMKQTEIGMAFL